MDERIRINIQVGDVKHPLFVKRDEEPIFREAAKLINERILAYSKKYRGANLPKDYIMAFAAIDIASRFVKQDRDSNAQDAEVKIRELAKEIGEFMKE
ncbi:MAG: cell division protein ZapA [Bacteroidales bacterium]|nr:cell division protein ZapA [Bacteroidales bacterium]